MLYHICVCGPSNINKSGDLLGEKPQQADKFMEGKVVSDSERSRRAGLVPRERGSPPNPPRPGPQRVGRPEGCGRPRGSSRDRGSRSSAGTKAGSIPDTRGRLSVARSGAGASCATYRGLRRRFGAPVTRGRRRACARRRVRTRTTRGRTVRPRPNGSPCP